MTLTAQPQPWGRPAAPAPMPTADEAASGLTVTDRAVLRDGVAFVPVSGEIHYSRVPRARWAERLRRMRAGGITVAATYVFWIHHEPVRGEARFDDHLDVGAFVDECAAAGLDVALRIGPWAHGEVRNGGFPDWVQAADVAHRTDDPAYLALVAEWFGRLAEALDGRARPGGPVIAIQLENELYDRPEHIVTLKRLAREAGIVAPLWTATAWGGAELPEGEVFPLYGGYGDGFWTEPDAAWDPTFRAHYFFSHEWDDPGVGADVRAQQGFGQTSIVTAPSAFPPATCELAGGMATAYHRRPRPSGLDVAAVAHGKIGNGSTWQGYYMYAGGTNPGLDLEESHATGYPNDMQRLGYDFHAALGQSGDASDGYALLRVQHAFLDAFGERLAELPSTLPDTMPNGIDDAETLRWAVRSDGESGFVFVSRHQPHVPLGTYAGAQFRLGDVVLPSEPVDIPAGTLARWPFGLRIGDGRLRWATASAVTVLDGPVPTLVLMADAGIPAELAADGADPLVVEPSTEPVRLPGFDVLVLPSGSPVWVTPDRTLLLSEPDLMWDASGTVRLRSREDGAGVRAYDPATRAWSELQVAHRGIPAADATLEPVRVRAAGDVPPDYGFAGQRHSAPTMADIDERAAIFRLDLPSWALDPAHDAVVEIDWAGDAAQLRVGDRVVDDRYADGSRWRCSIVDMVLATGEGDVTLHVLPLSPESTVWLPEDAAARRAASAGPLLSIDTVRVVSRGPWRHVAPVAAG